MPAAARSPTGYPVGDLALAHGQWQVTHPCSAASNRPRKIELLSRRHSSRRASHGAAPASNRTAARAATRRIRNDRVTERERTAAARPVLGSGAAAGSAGSLGAGDGDHLHSVLLGEGSHHVGHLPGPSLTSS